MVRRSMVVISAQSARPLGVSLIAVVVAMFGLFTALLGVLEWQTGIVTGIFGLSRGAGYEFLGGPAGIAIGIAYIVASIGLWNLRRWSWWLAIIAGIVGFVLALGSLIGMLIWAGFLAYLFVVRGNFGVLGGVPQATQG